MRKNSLENRYYTALYKQKKLLNKGIPNLTESEKTQYDALVVLTDLLKEQIRIEKPLKDKNEYKKRGGAQLGAGRPKRDYEDKKLTCSISIYPATKRNLIAKYGTLTKAIETILGEN